MLRLVAVVWAVPIDLPPIDLVSKPRVADAATLIPAVRELYNAGLAELGDDEDYTGIVKRLERQVGVELEG